MFGRKKRRLQRFAARELQSVNDIFTEYYRDSGLEFHDFSEVWSLIAFHLGIAPERLRPTDRFDYELRPEEGTELLDELEDLTVFVRVEADRRGKSLDVQQVKSIDDVLKLLVRVSKV